MPQRADPRRILVVTFPFPPAPIVGGNRWVAMRDHLRARGHAVTVLTTSAFGSLPDDAEQDVVRTLDLMASPALRRLLRRPPVPVAGTAPQADTPPPAVLTRVVVPDAYLASWTPFAAAVARRLIRERRHDAVVTTTPYESAHVIGLALRRHVPWIADFRDGWCFEPHRPPFPLGLQRRADRALERTVARRADAVLAATHPIARDFRARLGVPAHYVPNGWDPRLEAAIPPAAPVELEDDRVNLVYTGKLSGGWGRDPRPLLDALRALADEPDVAGRLRLVIASRLDQDESRLLAERGGPLVRHVGTLSRLDALALQRHAGALVLLTSRNVSEATGKLFEYLGARRPILALADGNEAARIVRETGTGVTVAPDDTAAIADALRSAARGALARAYAPAGLERYVYPQPAVAVERIVEDAIRRRQSARATACS